MAFAQIRKEAGIGCGIYKNEQIIQEIIDLGNIALSEKEMDEMKKLFHENSNHIQFILSNEEEFKKVKEFCKKIELFLKSPMRIEAEKSVAQKVYFGHCSKILNIYSKYLESYQNIHDKYEFI